MNIQPNLLIVDLFCGAGGTTIGFDSAVINGRKVAKIIAAVNHDPKAIESHWKNHPNVHHFEEDIRTLDLSDLKHIVAMQTNLYPRAKVILWASLECTNFSKAKGGKPRDADSRTLANHLHRYVQALNPDYIQIENVVEFMSWGPLDTNGKPVSRKNGRDWMRWRKAMCDHGYTDEWCQLNSADFGARTSRNRLFGCFARLGLPMTWPEPTHQKNPTKGMFYELKKWEPCRPCLDLEDKGTSIFTPGKIKSEKTFERILAGLIKYVACMGQREFISKYFSGKPEGKNISIDSPAGTIRTVDGQALVQTEFFVKPNSTAVNGDCTHSAASVDLPCPTIPTQRQPSIVQAEFIASYYSSGHNCTSLNECAPTVMTGDRHSLISPEWIDRQFSSGTKNSSVNVPIGALLPVPKANLVQLEFIMDTQFGNIGSSTNDPLPTITANRKWHYLMNPQYLNLEGSIDKPCFTLIARMDKMPPYLIEVESGQFAIQVYAQDSENVRKIKWFMALYGIVDIKMRMLRVLELKKIQGFPENYYLAGNQSDQKKFIGNSVHPIIPKRMAEVLSSKLVEKKNNDKIRSKNALV